MTEEELVHALLDLSGVPRVDPLKYVIIEAPFPTLMEAALHAVHYDGDVAKAKRNPLVQRVVLLYILKAVEHVKTLKEKSEV